VLGCVISAKKVSSSIHFSPSTNLIIMGMQVVQLAAIQQMKECVNHQKGG